MTMSRPCSDIGVGVKMRLANNLCLQMSPLMFQSHVWQERKLLKHSLHFPRDGPPLMYLWFCDVPCSMSLHRKGGCVDFDYTET